MENHEGRPLWVTMTLVGLTLAMTVTFVLLGNWQMRRLTWKLDLIEQVETRLAEEATAAPLHADKDDAYLRINTIGVFDHDAYALIQAVTELGPGFWLMTPLVTENGILWVNRGFVPTKRASNKEWTRPAAQQSVTGLLRISVPDGTLLQKNDPKENLWYSADIEALSAARDYELFLPYYIDSVHAGAITDYPRGGMTRVRFKNNHLQYALTWYAMAVLLLGTVLYLMWIRDE